jgi:hypothetical protein
MYLPQRIRCMEAEEKAQASPQEPRIPKGTPGSPGIDK